MIKNVDDAVYGKDYSAGILQFENTLQSLLLCCMMHCYL